MRTFYYMVYLRGLEINYRLISKIIKHLLNSLALQDAKIVYNIVAPRKGCRV